MHEQERLGNALREQFNALVTGIEPSEDLLARVEALTHASVGAPRPALPVRLRRRLLIAIPAPVAAVVAAVVLLFGGSAATPPPAFALIGNGGVRVTISELMGVTAANRQLRALHIHNMVVVPLTASCSNTAMSYTAGKLNPSPRITLRPQSFSKRWIVVLGAKQIAPNVVELAFGHFEGRIPTCASSHGTGPGMAGFHP